MAALAQLVVLLALALTVTWLVSWPVLMLWRRVVDTFPRAAVLNVLALAVPLLIGLVVTAGAIWPSSVAGGASWACHCIPGSGAVHLCPIHPAESLPLLPAAVFLLIWLGWQPARVARDVGSRLLAARRLVHSAAGRFDPRHNVLLADLPTANAFTAGLLRTDVVADRRWWRDLSAGERKIVAAHERAHARCHDPLTHTVGRLLAGLSSARLSLPLLTAWLQRAELRADHAAADAVGDPLSVADLLLREARLDPAPSLVPAFRGHDLEGRVHALLAPARSAPHLASDLIPGVALVAGAMLLAGAFGFQIHATIDQLLRLHP